MPFVNIKLVEGAVSPEEKHAMDMLERTKAVYERIDGRPITRNALAAAAPVGSRRRTQAPTFPDVCRRVPQGSSHRKEG